MRPIYFWALIMGLGLITGAASLSNVLLVNSQGIGIFDFFVEQYSCQAGTLCPPDVIPVTEENDPRKDGRVIVCHMDRDMKIESHALKHHLKHGDSEGKCEKDDDKHDDDKKLLNFDDDVQNPINKNKFLELKNVENMNGCPVSFWGELANSEVISFDGKHWPVGYPKDDKFGSSPFFNISIQNSVKHDPSLYDALVSQGDGINKLARQSVAALLNSAHSQINYPLSILEIISYTQQAISDEDYSIADEFSLYNNLGKESFCDSPT